MQLLFFGDTKHPEELYDLKNDPHEIHNLAKDQAFATELQKHRDILAEWIATTGDQGQQSEFDIGLLFTLKRWAISASTRNMIACGIY